jgi:ribonuclease D
MSVDGANALEQTVARLFASPSSTLVGFSCRQDLSRLRSSPCARAVHWFGKTDAVVDLQLVVTAKDPKLSKLGLSRVCHSYLGKPLDKAEQCSMWTARPLSFQQRVYGALDAWVCVAVYDKTA